MYEAIAQNFLADALVTFRAYKELADKAMAQVSEEEFFKTIDDESNSIAIIVKHIVGNMFSRWTDFLTTDGEKPNRERDMEFVMLDGVTKDEMLKRWEEGWRCVYDAIEPLKPDDLARTVYIRGQAHTVLEAINRQLAHYPSHIGQITFLAKHFRGADWKTLSVPKNKSAEFNAYLEEKKRAGETVNRYAAPQAFVKENEK
jgi:hypothetical protein